MIALGVDPGTLQLGWGIVCRDGNRLEHRGHGVVHLSGGSLLAERLVRIDQELDRIIEIHRPEVGSVETLFFHKDAQAAAKLGHARGVVLLCLARRGVAVVEYEPARVKRTVTGRGRASKAQVAQLVRAALALDTVPPSDAADALALAITHLRIGPLVERLAAQRSRLVGSATASGRRQPAGPAAVLGGRRSRRRAHR